jgi:predicted RNase H-like nuclease (RuvC/YqgF family)
MNMDENNVAVTEQTVTEQTEPVKTEPAKDTDINKLKAEVEKLKASLSKANSEAAEYKRQRNAEMDKSKLAEVERAEADKAMREELETLRKEKRVSDYTGKCLALNMDADLAGKTANALADGDMESVFDCLKDFVDATVTRLNNEALNRQPNLSTGVPPTKNTTVDTDYENMRRWMGAPSRK